MSARRSPALRGVGLVAAGLLGATAGHGAYRSYVYEREIEKLAPGTNVSEVALERSSVTRDVLRYLNPRPEDPRNHIVLWSDWWSGQTHAAEVNPQGVVVHERGRMIQDSPLRYVLFLFCAICGLYVVAWVLWAARSWFRGAVEQQGEGRGAS